MGILRDFEARLEGAVEGFFARVFRSGLQPVELAKALQRYASNYRQVGIDGVFVPNVYRFGLSQDDAERFRGFGESLKQELADVVRRTARERGWHLQGPVRIELVPSDEVAVGRYEVRGKVEALPASTTDGPHRESPRRVAAPMGGETAVLPAVGATAVLHLLGGPDPGRSMKLDGRTIIGRLSECDVQLDDPSVSRRHARIDKTMGGWAIEDLGSTNGVRINGSEVGRATLSHGDTIELGSVRLTFSQEG